MTSLDRIQDLDQLRQVAHLLVHENERLHQRLTALLQENARLRGVGAREQLALEIQQLQEQMAGLQRRLFAASSEKRPAAPAADAPREGGEPARGHGPRPQQLPLRQVDWKLPEAARRCPACEGELTEMRDQHEESEEITVVQRQFVRLTHRRQKYRCRCEATVVTAPGPPKLIPGGRYSVDFAVEVAASKYLEHLPLERQVRSMAREGLQADSQTLWDQLDALARLGHVRGVGPARARRAAGARRRNVVAVAGSSTEQAVVGVVGGERTRRRVPDPGLARGGRRGQAPRRLPGRGHGRRLWGVRRLGTCGAGGDPSLIAGVTSGEKSSKCRSSIAGRARRS